MSFLIGRAGPSSAVRSLRRWTTVALAVVVLAVTVTFNVALRRDTVAARATSAELHGELVDVEEHLTALAAERARLEEEQAVASSRLVASADRLEAAGQAEAEALERLRQRSEERAIAQEELRLLQSSVIEAAEQTEQNESSLRALDQCLDGATRASNSLSVGDVHQALASVEEVRGTCEQVGVVIDS